MILSQLCVFVVVVFLKKENKKKTFQTKREKFSEMILKVIPCSSALI